LNFFYSLLVYMWGVEGVTVFVHSNSWKIFPGLIFNANNISMRYPLKRLLRLICLPPLPLWWYFHVVVFYFLGRIRCLLLLNHMILLQLTGVVVETATRIFQKTLGFEGANYRLILLIANELETKKSVSKWVGSNWKISL